MKGEGKEGRGGGRAFEAEETADVGPEWEGQALLMTQKELGVAGTGPQPCIRCPDTLPLFEVLRQEACYSHTAEDNDRD